MKIVCFIFLITGCASEFNKKCNQKICKVCHQILTWDIVMVKEHDRMYKACSKMLNGCCEAFLHTYSGLTEVSQENKHNNSNNSVVINQNHYSLTWPQLCFLMVLMIGFSGLTAGLNKLYEKYGRSKIQAIPRTWRARENLARIDSS